VVKVPPPIVTQRGFSPGRQTTRSGLATTEKEDTTMAPVETCTLTRPPGVNPLPFTVQLPPAEQVTVRLGEAAKAGEEDNPKAAIEHRAADRMVTVARRPSLAQGLGMEVLPCRRKHQVRARRTDQN
jgi:hypothetical protein